MAKYEVRPPRELYINCTWRNKRGGNKRTYVRKVYKIITLRIRPYSTLQKKKMTKRRIVRAIDFEIAIRGDTGRKGECPYKMCERIVESNRCVFDQQVVQPLDITVLWAESEDNVIDR